MQALTTTPKINIEDESSRFLRNLVRGRGVQKEEDWHNNNSTLHQRAIVLDLENLRESPSQIIHDLFIHNRENRENILVAVPVAGWTTGEPTEGCSLFALFSKSAREGRLLGEYAQSFSLSPFTTAKNANLILRVSKAAQKMEVFKQGDATFFRVSAGVRITDADEYLFKKGLALPPNMPTLHVASLVGAAANGCYGPGRDYTSMTSNIVEMKIVNAIGQRLVLSATENPDLFNVLRDCHMSSGCFVSEITLANIQPKFLMRRHNVLYKNVIDFTKKMYERNQLTDEHFIAMYIPVDIQKEDNTSPRIRVTTFAKTNEPKKNENKCFEQKDLSAYLSLMTAEAGEPLIDLIVRSETLRPFFPFILKTAALKTFGIEEETIEIDWSASIAHIFSTYTDLPLCDINWLIQVNSSEEARDLLIALLHLTENLLKQYAEKNQFPLFNAFSRYLRGIYYPEGQGGVAATAVNQPHQSILSFEFVTYTQLAETEAFKHLVNEVVRFLSDRGLIFKYHPGKTWPDNVRSLTQIFNDAIGKKRLQNFKEAVYKLHGGELNIPFSPLLTPQKKEFIGLEAGKGKAQALIHQEVIHERCTKSQETGALKKILELAQEQDNKEIIEQVRKKLEA